MEQANIINGSLPLLSSPHSPPLLSLFLSSPPPLPPSLSSPFPLLSSPSPRYDVELFQRIEQLIGKRLPLYLTVEEEVMALMERVSEAQRYAKMVGHAFDSRVALIRHVHASKNTHAQCLAHVLTIRIPYK